MTTELDVKDVGTMGKMDTFLRRSMSEQAYETYRDIIGKLPDIWERPTSSTGKYHRRKDGTVPTCAEHTYEMVVACAKVMRLFPLCKPPSSLADSLLLATALHDAMKYGADGDRTHTDNEHDKRMADWLKENLSVNSGVDNSILVEIVRYHSGQWSTNARKNDYSPHTCDGAVLFVHVLDMLSTANMLSSEGA